jgi:hypothetical protein
MRFRSGFGLFLAFSLGAFAQQQGARATGATGFHRSVVVQGTAPLNPRTFAGNLGNTINGGGSFAANLGNTVSGGSSFAANLGRTVSGDFTPLPQIGFRQRGRGRFGGPIVGAYPVFIGNGYYYGDNSYSEDSAAAYPSYGYQPPANITIIMPQNAPPPAVNQYGAPSGQAGVEMYQEPNPQRPEPPDDQILFFIALKDSSIYTAVAYWVEDGTLHYITPQGKQNQVSLALVDRQTSARLNEGRKVEFHLPAP